LILALYLTLHRVVAFETFVRKWALDSLPSPGTVKSRAAKSLARSDIPHGLSDLLFHHGNNGFVAVTNAALTGRVRLIYIISKAERKADYRIFFKG